MYDTNQFETDLEEFGIVLSEKQLQQFMDYYELLMEWNSIMNLTKITEFDDVMKKHFVDSVSLINAIDLTSDSKGSSSQRKKLIDIGTGAGFPGIPLKIVFPDLEVTLLDSVHKKVKFLDEVIEKLELDKIKAVHGRAEDYAKPDMMREKYDICASRAVANLSTLTEYCLPFVRKGGFFVSYKSEKLSEELENAKKAIFLLGGKIEDQIEFTLPSSDIFRNLLVIKKVKETPRKFPRKAGLASKEPIL